MQLTVPIAEQLDVYHGEGACASGRATIAVGVAWFVACWGARAFLERPERATWLKVSVALLPVPIFAAFLVMAIRMIRGMDKLERRIHLEALAIAYPLALLLLMTLALMQRAVNLSFEDWSYAHVWIYLPIFYFLSLGLVSGRYK